MLISHARLIDYIGQPPKSAQLYVMRNDGFCWGRIVLADGTNLDVDSVADYYWSADEHALDMFEELSTIPRHVSPAEGWPLERDLSLVKEN